MISSLIISLAFAHKIHWPDMNSFSRHMEGDWEERQQIERQWEYEKKVIEAENRLEDLERERERQSWEYDRRERMKYWND